MILNKKKPNPDLPTYEVVIGGKCVGDVRPSPSTREQWHAAINCPVPVPFPYDHVLIQAHGATPEEAVAKAIDDSVVHYKAVLEAVTKFRNVFIEEKTRQ